MQYPYLITSDQHCHSWSAFAKVNPDGVNSRLQIILDELRRAHRVLRDEGGHYSFFAGDLFHVRGKIEPSVFNPTFNTIQRIMADDPDLVAFAIPGNHDLEGSDAEALGNAMQQLAMIDRFCVDTSHELHGDVLMVPWFKNLNDLRECLASEAASLEKAGRLDKTDVIIHAPVNGVIRGLPDHGLNADELAAFGFRRVFAGHYHNHKVMADGKVISIGATTHQTWNDPGTQAGFLLVWPDRIEWHESQAPKFVDLTFDGAMVDDDLTDLVGGNYVRVRLTDVEEKEIKEWRRDLEKAGAVGVQVLVTKTASVTRTGASAKASVSIEASVEHYIRTDMKPFLIEEVSKEAADVLLEARS